MNVMDVDYLAQKNKKIEENNKFMVLHRDDHIYYYKNIQSLKEHLEKNDELKLVQVL